MSDKRWLIWFRHGPFGTSYAREGLDLLLVLGAFDQRVSAFFERDALSLIQRNRDCAELGMKDFGKGFAALPLYGVSDIYYDPDTLAELGISRQELTLEAKPLSRGDLAAFIQRFDHVLSF